MLRSTRLKTTDFLLIIILAIALFFGAKQLALPMIAEGDAYSRALIGKKLIENHTFFQLSATNVWLPLHFSIINIPHWLGFDLFFGQRAITMLISLGGIMAIYFLTTEYYQNKTISLLASSLFAFFPLRMVLADQTLSESIFITFFIFFCYFLIKDKKNFLDLVLIVVLNLIACLIRFESWFFLPITSIFLIFDKKMSMQTKINLITALTLPSLVWILNNKIESGQSLSFFREKYDMAQKTFNPRYFNLQKTWQDWKDKLEVVFPSSFLILSLIQIKNYQKNINAKSIIIYLTPIYLFLLLIVQVYLGTMEWLPIRYLLIPCAFLFPLMGKTIYELGNFFLNYVENNKPIWSKLLAVSFYISLVLITGIEYKTALTKSKQQLTTFSFLSIEKEADASIEEYEKIKSFDELSEFIKNQKNKDGIEYYYSEKNRSWQDQALFYFTSLDGEDLSKDQLAIAHDNENLIVWEREPFGEEPLWNDKFEIKFINKDYFVATD